LIGRRICRVLGTSVRPDNRDIRARLVTGEYLLIHVYEVCTPRGVTFGSVGAPRNTNSETTGRTNCNEYHLSSNILRCEKVMIILTR
jgi:hypothetical protein